MFLLALQVSLQPEVWLLLLILLFVIVFTHILLLLLLSMLLYIIIVVVCIAVITAHFAIVTVAIIMQKCVLTGITYQNATHIQPGILIEHNNNQSVEVLLLFNYQF